MELKSALLICVVICVVVNATNGNNNRQTKKEQSAKFRLHEQILRREGKCEPKIRLAYISDHPDAEPDVVYYPPAAVLHLCASTGSCCYGNGLYRCKPSEEETVEVVFSANRPGERPAFQAFTFTNHTQCACMDISELPR